MWCVFILPFTFTSVLYFCAVSLDILRSLNAPSVPTVFITLSVLIGITFSTSILSPNLVLQEKQKLYPSEWFTLPSLEPHLGHAPLSNHCLSISLIQIV